MVGVEGLGGLVGGELDAVVISMYDGGLVSRTRDRLVVTACSSENGGGGVSPRRGGGVVPTEEEDIRRLTKVVLLLSCSDRSSTCFCI